MKKTYNRWIICAGGTLLLFCAMGLPTSAFAVYQPHLISNLALSDTQASMVITVRSLFALGSLFFVEQYLKRFGLRVSALLSTLGAALAFFIYGSADGFFGCCAAAALAGMTFSLGGMVPVSLLISRWFDTRRSLALGICAAGTGAATIVVPPVATHIIETFSLRAALWTEAAVLLAGAVVVFALIRNWPEGAEKTAEIKAAGQLQTGGNIPRSERLGMFCMIPAVMILGIAANPGFAHLAVLYTTAGFSSDTAAWLVSLVGTSLLIGKCLYGQTADRLGAYRASFLFYVVLVAGHALSCLAGPGGIVSGVAAMVILGLGLPLPSVGLSVLAGELVAPERYGRTVKQYQAWSMVGALLFGPVPGMMADLTGSYVPAYAILTVLCLIAMVLTVVAFRLKKSPDAA